jgi:hypothetical protein
VLAVGEAAEPPEDAAAEEGWPGGLVAGAGGLAGAGGGAGLADAGPAVPEPEPAVPVPVELGSVGLPPVEPVVEPAGELEAPEAAAEVPDEAVELADDVADDAVEPAADVTGDVAEATVEATGDVAELTVEVTGDVAEPSVDEAPESEEVSVALRGDRAAVAAWAGRENSSMTTKMPAVASAACTTTRAMRRAVGCMSSSHSTRNQAARLPSGGGANLAHTELLFGHHRTVRSPIGQGREVAAKGPNRPRSPARPPEQGSQIRLT